MSAQKRAAPRPKQDLSAWAASDDWPERTPVTKHPASRKLEVNLLSGAYCAIWRTMGDLSSAQEKIIAQT